MSNTKHPAGHVLQAYHDGELDPPAATEVAAHCERCATCRTELTELRRLDQLLASAPTPELPRTVWHRVRPGQARETRLKPIFAFTACAAGIILGVLLGPITFSTEETRTDLAWSEVVTVWNGSATSSLLAVYQSRQE
jgi:anti-sigma factor RsiW